jgi:Na+/H+ antiporter NhaD/arsenite permease-like protein
MRELFLPSVVCLLVPLLMISRKLTGDLEPAEKMEDVHKSKGLSKGHQWLFLILGVGGLLFVPVFKSVTHLPPFMGIILVLSILWIVSELMSHKIDESVRSSTGVLHVLRNIDMSSILFFLGILLAVSALGSIGLLGKLAVWLNAVIPAKWIVATIIGLLSAIVDNVPLVAAGIEMYGGLAASDPVAYGQDGFFWMMLAFCAGTGGSCLIIGSAAGVAAMGLEKIEFVWYLRKIGPLALAGYLSGVTVYLLQYSIFSMFS